MRIMVIILAGALALGSAPAAFAKSKHKGHYARSYHGIVTRHVSMPRSGSAPAAVSPRGGDRAPITGGGY